MDGRLGVAAAAAVVAGSGGGTDGVFGGGGATDGVLGGGGATDGRLLPALGVECVDGSGGGWTDGRCLITTVGVSEAMTAAAFSLSSLPAAFGVVAGGGSGGGWAAGCGSGGGDASSEKAFPVAAAAAALKPPIPPLVGESSAGPGEENFTVGGGSFLPMDEMKPMTASQGFWLFCVFCGVLSFAGVVGESGSVTDGCILALGPR